MSDVMLQGRLLYCFPPPDFDQSHCFNSQLMEHVNPSRDQTASYDPSLDLILPSVTNRSQVSLSCDLVVLKFCASQASRTVGKVRNPDALFLYQVLCNYYNYSNCMCNNCFQKKYFSHSFIHNKFSNYPIEPFSNEYRIVGLSRYLNSTNLIHS